MNSRRDFLKAGTVIMPALALGLPLLNSAPLKVFCLDSGGDTSYIIADSPERVKHWWFTELAGEPIPDDAEVEEISPDTIISQGIEDLEDISEEDKKSYLYYHLTTNNSKKSKLKKWTKEIGLKSIWPAQLHEGPDFYLHFCVIKPAALFLKDTIENKYPIPCCFCTTAGR